MVYTLPSSTNLDRLFRRKERVRVQEEDFAIHILQSSYILLVLDLEDLGLSNHHNFQVSYSLPLANVRREPPGLFALYG